MSFPEKPPASPGSLEFLQEVQSSPAYEKLARMAQDEYAYWEKVKYWAKDMNEVESKILWHYIKFRRRFTYHSFVLPFNNRKNGFTFLVNLPDKLLAHLYTLDKKFFRSVSLPESEKSQYQLSSIMEEAIASSQIEGASTTREKAKEMLKKRKQPTSDSEKMIVNNYNTILLLMKLRDEAITQERILEIHGAITKGTLKNQDYEGQYRQTDEINVVDNITGEIAHIPPTFRLIPELMAELIIFLNTKQEGGSFVHPIVKASIAHFMIGYIHPFIDGNGRTARALFYWYLLSEGYWLMEYISISRIILGSKARYANAFLQTEYDENDLTYFIMYSTQALSKAIVALEQYILRKSSERKESASLILSEQFNARQIDIMESIIMKPEKMYSIYEVRDRFEVVYQTARTDLLDLVDKGFLKKLIQGKRLLFVKSEQFDTKIRELNTNA